MKWLLFAVAVAPFFFGYLQVQDWTNSRHEIYEQIAILDQEVATKTARMKSHYTGPEEKYELAHEMERLRDRISVYNQRVEELLRVKPFGLALTDIEKRAVTVAQARRITLENEKRLIAEQKEQDAAKAAARRQSVIREAPKPGFWMWDDRRGVGLDKPF